MGFPALQVSLPGGQSLPGGPILIIGLVTLLAIALPAYYVYNDARKRNNEDKTLWTVATILGGLVGGGLIGTVSGALLVVILYVIVGQD